MQTLPTYINKREDDSVSIDVIADKSIGFRIGIILEEDPSGSSWYIVSGNFVPGFEDAYGGFGDMDLKKFRDKLLLLIETADLQK